MEIKKKNTNRNGKCENTQTFTQPTTIDNQISHIVNFKKEVTHLGRWVRSAQGNIYPKKWKGQTNSFLFTPGSARSLNDALVLINWCWCTGTYADLLMLMLVQVMSDTLFTRSSCQLNLKFRLLLSTFAKFWNLCCFCHLTMRIEKWVKYHISKTNSALVAVWN